MQRRVPGGAHTCYCCRCRRRRRDICESRLMIKYYFITADICSARIRTHLHTHTHMRVYMRIFLCHRVWTEAERAACAIIMKSARACICAVTRTGIIFIRGHRLSYRILRLAFSAYNLSQRPSPTLCIHRFRIVLLHIYIYISAFAKSYLRHATRLVPANQIPGERLAQFSLNPRIPPYIHYTRCLGEIRGRA